MSLTNPALIVARAALGVLTLVAVAVQLVSHLASGFPVLNFFSYFTILCNSLAGVVLLLGAYLGATKADVPRWYDGLRAATVVYMAVVGVVFVALLRNVDLGGLKPWINATHHYLMPVVMVVDWLVCRPRQGPDARSRMVTLVFPLVYVIYVLLRGAAVGWYPYPFLNPALVGGYPVVAAYVAGMVVTFVVAGLLVGVVHRRQPAAQAT